MNTPQNRECRMHYNVKYLKTEPTELSDWDEALKLRNHPAVKEAA